MPYIVLHNENPNVMDRYTIDDFEELAKKRPLIYYYFGGDKTKDPSQF